MSSIINPGEEIRVTSDTGGSKGMKAAQASALDPVALWKLAEVAGMGAQKYSAHNYLAGYRWSLSVDALQRHVWLHQSGEDVDSESGLPHMAHAAWHALALVSFMERGLGDDDRFKQPEPDLEPMPVWDTPLTRPFLSGDVTAPPGSGPSLRDATERIERLAQL